MVYVYDKQWKKYGGLGAHGVLYASGTKYKTFSTKAQALKFNRMLKR